MNIPTGLKKLLQKNQNLSGMIDIVCSTMDPILSDNKVPFFPEYTDHGLTHVDGVLQTAYALVSDKARPVLTSSDAAALVLSCILHDLAMHITKDGFVTLVSTSEQWSIVSELGDRPWPDLWADFRSEAKRFDNRTLTRLFGSTEPVAVPQMDSQDWNEKQLKLIGEFIRRHHHRLAHQIALNGLPGPDQQRLKLERVDPDVADIAGFVARSHGMPIRDGLSYLSKYHALREYKGIHAVFLMALLRVADFLQIEAARAPRQLLAVKRLRSPVSQGEWSAHAAIRDISAGTDTESLFINALPTDVKTYLRLRELMTSLQAELDASWAVLGEVYSRYTKEKLDRLGLCLRRVTSNLDNTEEFAAQVEYVPCRAAFDTAGAELMNLLVEPLYGDHPKIAIRELLQNSVDAVRELNEYCQMNAQSVPNINRNQSADILLTLTHDERDEFWIRIDDKGIGMTAETLQKYFLKAGATLRSSLDWRQTFENEHGGSRVLRSGRFGLGVFAVLLLGETIFVSTRYVSSPVGVEFHASLAEEAAEFRKCERPVGTSVSIRIDDETALKLIRSPKNWDWYLLDAPSVARRLELNGRTRLIEMLQASIDETGLSASAYLDKNWASETGTGSRDWLPSPGTDLPTGWSRICHENYTDVNWTYADAPILTCNGIRVIDDLYFDFEHAEGMRVYDLVDEFNRGLSGAFRFRLPGCSCFDPDGMFPLNLQRTCVTRPYPFMPALRDDVRRDFLAYALVQAPIVPLHDRRSLETYLAARYPGIDSSANIKTFANLVPFASTQAGVTLAERSLLCSALGDSTIGVVVQPTYDGRITCPEAILQLGPTIAELVLGFEDWRRDFWEALDAYIEYPYATGCHFAVNAENVVRLGVPSDNRTSLHKGGLCETANATARQGAWTLGSVGQCHGNNALPKLLEAATHSSKGDGIVMIVQWCFSGARRCVEESDLARHWRQYLGTAAIPYDPEERRDTLRDAYTELDAHIKRWEKIRQTEADVALGK